MREQKTRSATKSINKIITTLIIATFLTSVFNIPTRAQDDPWFDTNWNYRKPLTIDHTKIAGPLADFPILVSMTDPDLAAKAQNDGDDIVFTNQAGTRLKHEIETYTPATGTLIAWVKIPTLTNTLDTIIYLYYGNAQAGNQQTPTEVWDTSYLAVHHLAETTGNAIDSTVNNNNGAPNGDITQTATGKIGDADLFTNGRLLLPQLYSSQTQFTYEAWIYPTTGARYFLSQWNNYLGAFIQVGVTPDHFEAYINSTGWSISGSLDTWYHIVLTYDGTTARFYRNAGTPQTRSVLPPTWPAESMSIGDKATGGRPFKGTIDEARFSTIARNNTWITTEYTNQNQPNQFLTTGTEQSNNPVPIISNPNPQNGATNIPITLTTLSVLIQNPSGAPFSWTITTSPNIGSNSGSSSTNGTKTCPVSNLAYSTTYTWTVTATNSIGTTTATYSFTTEQQQGGGGSWAYMKNITINHEKVAGTLVYFPVLISINDSDLAGKAQVDGDDIYFESIEGTRYPHEIESYANGNLVAWVNIPSLSSTSDLRFRMYYGNPSCGPQENPAATWPADYLAVHHFEEPSGTVYDSTSNHNDGVPSGVTWQPGGTMNGNYYFDGTNDKITLPQIYSSQTTFTFSAWVYAQKASATIAAQWNSYHGVLMQIASTPDHIDAVIDGQSKTVGCSLNAWYYLVFTYNGATGYVYSNAGTPASRTFTPPTWPAENLFIGCRSTNNYYFKGTMDEVRFSNSFKSSAWIVTEYNNQNQPSSFYALGPEQELHGHPQILDEYPPSGSYNVPVTLTTLEFTLRSPAGEHLNYTITTQPDIIGGEHSGTNILNNTRITVPIVDTPLDYNHLYRWTVQAEAAGYTVTETYSFTTQGPNLGSWLYMKRIRIDHTKVAGNLQNFPVLVSIIDADLAAKAQSDGDDIYFGSIYNIRYWHEIEYFNHNTGELIAWVNIPALSSTTDTDVYMYYGNPLCGSQQKPTGVWSTDYLAVHHFAETTGPAMDSTAYSNDGSSYGNPTQQITGKIGDADGFDGIDDQFRLPQVYYNETSFTMEAWIYPLPGARIFLSQSNATSGAYLGVGSTQDRVEAYINGVGLTKTGLLLNNWSHVVWTHNGATHTSSLYLNAGTPATRTSNVADWPNERLYIGDRSLGNRQYKGILDEARLSTSVRSAAWITTEYTNMITPSSFYSVAAEQATSPIMFSDIYPRNQDANYNPRLSLYIDGRGQMLTVIFRTNATGTWTTIGTYNGGSGVYYQNTTGMTIKDKRYFWQIRVFNGQTWRNDTYYLNAKSFALKWRNELGADGATTGPQVTDVNGDGIYEAYFIKDKAVACVDSQTGVPHWIYRSGYINYHSQFELGDLNNDGIPEIVCSAGTHTIALHADTGSLYWNVPLASSNKNIVIGDIDGNHYPYVYICDDDVEHGSQGLGRLRKLRGTTGEELAQVFVWRPCYGSLSFADADNDGNFEIYMTDRAYDYHPPSYGKGMQAYDADTLKILWYQDKVTCSSQCMGLIDINNDGILDAVACQQGAEGFDSGLYIIDGLTWEKMIGKWANVIPGLRAHSTCSIYDIDNDGRPELSTASNSTGTVWDLGWWISGRPHLDGTLGWSFEPAKMANILGSSNLELIGTDSVIDIYNNQYQLVETIQSAALSNPCVQDTDNDGRNEMVTNTAGGSIKIYDTAAYASDPKPRADIEYYSERRLAAAVYIPPPGAPQPIIKKVSPADNGQDIQTTPLLCAKVIDYHYDRMNIQISTNASGSWQTIASWSNVGNGWYNVTASQMTQTSHRYFWRVTAVDPWADNDQTQQTFSLVTSTPPVIVSVNAPGTVVHGTPINISSVITDNDKLSVVKIAIQYPNGQVENNTALSLAPVWTQLRYDDFETSTGGYTIGGSDCARYKGYAHHGQYSMAMRDFMGVASSFALTNGIAGLANRYEKLRVSFWFRNNSMECRENFWLKYWDGVHWRIAGDFVSGTDFTNPTFYYKTVYIDNVNYTFHNNMKIRFQCDGDADSDLIYIDEVSIYATTNIVDHYYVRRTFSATGTYNYYVWAKDIQGNSIRSSIQSFTVT